MMSIQLSSANPTPATILSRPCLCFDYIEQQLAQGMPLAHFTRHILGLFKDTPGARAYRRTLTELAIQPNADIHTIERALSHLGAPPHE